MDRRRGFTLIELLVVIAIIGILASLALASFNSARLKSRDARRVADINQIKVALELYFDANANIYPADADGLGALDPAYITVVPRDPVGNTPYSYHRCVAPSSKYHLGASLEESTHAALSVDLDNTPCGAGESGDFANSANNDSGKCNSTDSGVACYDLSP
ncbi:hypothetical protein A2926_00535 [Candidatus Giovannonibacteria bacterium RIFCSPLOWO2_01_FULL_44_40]|uniref:Type II secretion system protein GspG C-terminal domain-containing protein n=1 Tax=Candidatus Giovannonibacteria bacterium RIFCSPHIGHO2_01_FULL_45_23 TaxID=1798325 RepID=A0A1F5VET5_9BACT|nr:MAG: hypothetical protein A2834_00550 [Candidatus Giovannonibacteria bacterium RIFCSPHIGHO2_01_FULL_45_23]OGF76532.1 MAG: hypothetical protein A3C77_03260 [Candidatus Giovannonibacteria bacterium RIFCSPHIGHO2_02_FULL_45_13]OGF79798.1 MAG: hypothetical protein A2926_00535 [Candidatus Giovannonibacteria bacterium RIFCSPLOWO2_01_FULL_44_40]